jgi:hypothetical protein
MMPVIWCAAQAAQGLEAPSIRKLEVKSAASPYPVGAGSYKNYSVLLSAAVSVAFENRRYLGRPNLR